MERAEVIDILTRMKALGIWRLRLWIIPGGGSLGSGIALFALNLILAGIIGGFVLAWWLVVAVWYVPLTVWRLIVG